MRIMTSLGQHIFSASYSFLMAYFKIALFIRYDFRLLMMIFMICFAIRIATGLFHLAFTLQAGAF